MATGTESDYAGTLLQHADRLAFLATVDAVGEPSIRDDEVRKIVRRSAELVRGASALGSQKNAVAIGVLARTILESLILMLWVEVSDENALHQSRAASAEIMRLARINLRRGSLKVRNRETGEDATQEILGSDRFSGLQKPKRISDLAQEAGVEDLYEVFYRFLSMAVHGHELGTKEGKLDEEVDLAMQAIGAISMAVGHAALRWLLHRERTDNETLRKMLGL